MPIAPTVPTHAETAYRRLCDRVGGTYVPTPGDIAVARILDRLDAQLDPLAAPVQRLAETVDALARDELERIATLRRLWAWPLVVA